jgi:hypothetical protein
MTEKGISFTSCKFFEKYPNTFKKSDAHLQCVDNNCAKFEECQPKDARGVDLYILVSTVYLRTTIKVQLQVNFSKNV